MSNKTDEKNLDAIKRHDVFAAEILSKSANCAIFDFDAVREVWEKANIEGPLFVYRRMDVPLYSIMIANKQSPKNFIQPLTMTLKLKYLPPYIYMFRKGTIQSLYVYGEDECKRIYKFLSSLQRPMTTNLQKPLTTALKNFPLPTAPVEPNIQVKLSDKTDGKNLDAIKRHDIFAEEILAKSANCAIFDFDAVREVWEKANFEGPLFVYRRMDVPLYSIMIANKQSPKNFIQPLTMTLKLKYLPPYIYMYGGNGVIQSLYVYGEDECKRIFKFLLSLQKSLTTVSKDLPHSTTHEEESNTTQVA